MTHTVLPAKHLDDDFISVILQYWDVKQWQHLSDEEFREKFAASDFHFLLNEKREILSLARMNRAFSISVDGEVLTFTELVGLVSVITGKGYAKHLLNHIIRDMKLSETAAIGFCEKSLRPFYEKCSIRILYGKAKYIFEKENDSWEISADDDILILNCPLSLLSVLSSLSTDHPAYIL